MYINIYFKGEEAKENSMNKINLYLPNFKEITWCTMLQLYNNLEHWEFIIRMLHNNREILRYFIR